MYVAFDVPFLLGQVRKEDREKEYRAISKEVELEEKLIDTHVSKVT